MPQEKDNSDADSIMLVTLVLFLGWLVHVSLLRVKYLKEVPYTALIFMLGLVIGFIDFNTDLGSISDALSQWTMRSSTSPGSGVDPNFFLFCFLPILIFGELFAGDVNRFVRGTPQAIILAFPGVLLSTFVFGFICKYVFPFGWSWSLSCAFGSMISATDPVAVLAIMKRHGVRPRLLNLMSGESILNDGSSIVLFILYLNIMSTDKTMGWYQIFTFFARNTVGALLLGTFFGILVLVCIKLSHRNKQLITVLTICSPYLVYYTAFLKLDISGILTLVPLGLIVGFGCQVFTGSELHSDLGSIWEFLEFCANTLIFFITGVLIAEDIVLRDYAYSPVLWLFVPVTYVISQVVRFVVVFSFYPVLCRIQPGLTYKEALLLIWGGLKGAIALSLSIVLLKSDIPEDLDNAHEAAFLMAGVVISTLLFNSTSTKFLIAALELTKHSPAQEKMFREIKWKIKESMRQIIRFASSGDYEPLSHFQFSFSSVRDPGLDGNAPMIRHEKTQKLCDSNILKEKRFRFLLTMKRKVTILHNHLLIGEVTTQLLLWVCESSLKRTDAPLQLWSSLGGFCSEAVAAKYERCVESKERSIFHVRQYFYRKMLVLGCEIAFAFLSAHEEGREAISGLFSETYTNETEAIIAESLMESEPSVTFLNYIKDTCPGILQKLKANQVRHSCFWEARKEVSILAMNGTIEHQDRIKLMKSVSAFCDRIRTLEFTLSSSYFAAQGKLVDNKDLFPFGYLSLLEEEAIVQDDALEEEDEVRSSMAQVLDKGGIPCSMKEITEVPEVGYVVEE
jgi:NhaP-type Na+/H+ or K+/H+ antiporter